MKKLYNAGKNYECKTCGEPIPKGERYAKVSQTMAYAQITGMPFTKSSPLKRVVKVCELCVTEVK